MVISEANCLWRYGDGSPSSLEMLLELAICVCVLYSMYVCVYMGVMGCLCQTYYSWYVSRGMPLMPGILQYGGYPVFPYGARNQLLLTTYTQACSLSFGHL